MGEGIVGNQLAFPTASVKALYAAGQGEGWVGNGKR
jgi:hypothetical protein